MMGRTERKGGGSRGRRGAAALFPPLLAAVLALALPLLSSGCGSQAARYAREARSAYIGARAVLVQVKELPSRMELLLRGEEDAAALAPRARAFVEEGRGLVSEAYAAFRTVQEKLNLLEGENDKEFSPYGSRLAALVTLNVEVVNAYAEYLGFCNAILEGLPFREDPGKLMPALNGMDRTMKRAGELSGEIEKGEEEAEALYRGLAG